MKKYTLLLFLLSFTFCGQIFGQTARDSMLLDPNTVLTSTAPVILISDMQKALTERGYYQGPIDNKLSKEVRAALTEFQKKENLPICNSMGDMSYLYRALGLIPPLH